MGHKLFLNEQIPVIFNMCDGLISPGSVWSAVLFCLLRGF